MILKSISFCEHSTGWNVNNLDIETLSLLVGASGVGKTKILRSILCLSKIASGQSFNGVEWRVMFSCNNNDCLWAGQFENKTEDRLSDFEKEFQSYSIIWEKLFVGGREIVRRENDELYFNNEKTVKLDFAKSAVELLKAETDVKPIYDAFKQIYLLNNAFRGIRFSASIGDNDEKMSDSTTLRENKVLTPLENLFLLYKNGLSEFEQIKSDFISIFTLVEEINFSTIRLFDGMTVPILRIREKGVDKWIYQDEISSGMLRTLSQIITLTLAKDGDVILVDEFENGLGVNCIDKLTDQIEFADKNIQVIITSHHPYIINHIPVQRWKIVTRDKSDVKVFTAAELHIGEHSRHDAFMQLIQKEEFKTGRR